MIAMIAGDEEMRSGPIPIALLLGGFRLRAAGAPESAEACLAALGPAGCVLVIDADSLCPPTRGAGWLGLLDRHRQLPAVAIGRGKAARDARAALDGAHRLVLEDPFDAAAVVSAVRSAASSRGLPIRRAARRLRDVAQGLER